MPTRRQAIRPAEEFRLELRVTNHAGHAQGAKAHLVLPEDWTASPAEASADVAVGEMAALRFIVSVPANAEPGRRVLVADLTLGERRYGQRAEAIVDVEPQRLTA